MPNLFSFGRSALCAAAVLLIVSCVSVRPATAAEVVLESVKPSQDGAAVNTYGLTRDDFKRIIHNIPSIRQLVPVRVMPQQALYGERVLDIELIGTVDQLAKLDELKTAQGRFLLEKDSANRNNVAVVDSLTARRLFPGEEAIGKNIRIADHYFLIVGQLPASTKKSRTAKRGRVYIPLTTMRARYGDTVVHKRSGTFELERYELSRIRAVLKSTDAKQVASVMETLMKKYHKKSDYTIRVVR